MNPLAELRGECQKLLEAALETAFPGTELPETKYSLPPNPEMGELSSPACFQLARALRQSPMKIAETLAEAIPVGDCDLIKSAEAIAGYVNFHVDPGHYNGLVLESIIELDKEYGFLKAESPGRVMIEHTSANPISPIHIGNARNSIIGDSLASLQQRRGHEVVIHFLVNDMGRQVAMTTYGWKLLGKPEPEGEAELWIGTIYASFNVINELKKLKTTLKEAEDNGRVYETSETQEEIDEYNIAAEALRQRYPGLYDKLAKVLVDVADPTAEMVALNTRYENNEPETVDEVRTQIQYCLDGFEASLGEIGIMFNSFDFESDLVWAKAADAVLEKLVTSGYVINDMGAQILDCDKIAKDLGLKERWGLHPEHEIPRLVLVRSDGTTLYTLRDMAYTIHKFGYADRIINVIGMEQTLAQLQLRIALAAIGEIEMGDNQVHYAYEFVKLPGIKMSGRLGRYVTLNEVLRRAEGLAREEVENRNPGLPEEEKAEIAQMVGYGAVKYTLLSVDPMKQVTFDWNKALNFETNSAPFIQYSHARTCNILKRSDERPEPGYGELTATKERELVNLLAQFPETFERAAEELQPSNLTAYANMLADKFNSFYATQSVLKAETMGLMGARINVVNATRITLRNILDVLGIDSPNRM
ncbi:arginine--tRNA ligase [Candidatus Bathyarchaeota archaeon]|jgi:arginyl-tRNA synthetase|nr:arginine--tRNA ligase [Candidatus Bathyarchaeota archaeon]MBT4424730.1 arginine--tRNA ligase [Candidatus Bathyarchaeota archaeon]MBT6604317.1 arginine--tRNA ligase [Candidatus Bathyarchaeota archaeon]MBT7187156.1 arginine--tRNA ligase [Candidatus Bathyarchaeota archaeon]MBT7347014.1 arginine--tRNA ligase [Candidatus Bathyarchaeota archaeon]